MQIIKAGYQLIDEPNITKKIERIARICYKSEDKIGEGTDLKMIKDLIERKHTAMLEHGDLAFIVDEETYQTLWDIKAEIETMLTSLEEMDTFPQCYLRFTRSEVSSRCIVSGNIRAWIHVLDYAATTKMSPDEAWFVPRTIHKTIEDLLPFTKNWYYCEEEYDHCTFVDDYSLLDSEERMIHETMSILFTVDRGVTHELVRHRPVSFAQESTRYCNYSLGKYGKEITVIEPCFFAKPDTVDLPTEDWAEKYGAWRAACEASEQAYFRLIDAKAPAQQARDVLPTSVKAEIVMTTNLREWKHIFNLRACDATGPAHPQMKEVMIPAFKEARAKYPFAYGNMYAADEVHE